MSLMEMPLGEFIKRLLEFEREEERVEIQPIRERIMVERERHLIERLLRSKLEVKIRNMRAFKINVGSKRKKILEATPSRKSFIIRNMDDTNTVYIGGSDVSSDGFPIKPNEALSDESGFNGEVWAISPSGSIELRVIETW